MCLAIPGQIQSISTNQNGIFRTANVSFGGVKREVNLAAVPEAKVGDYVLVHVGMALSVIDEKEAQRTLEYFEQLDEINRELGDKQESDQL